MANTPTNPKGRIKIEKIVGNIVEFIIKLKDQMSGGMQAAAATAQRAIGMVENAGNRAQRSIQNTATAVRTATNNSARSISVLERGLQRLEYRRSISLDRREILQANNDIRRLQERIANLRGERSGGGGFGGLRGLAAGVALTASLGTVVNAGMQGQQQKASMEVMAGQQKGGQLYGELNKFAQESIFGNEVFHAAQTMKAFGLETDKVMPTLKMLGDISMGDKERLGSLTLAFSQVTAAGRLTGQDLLQLINAGFNPLQIISQKTGISLVDLKKKMEDGAISAKMVEMAFQAATGPGGQFFNMTNKIAATDFGKLEAAKGQVQGLALKIGTMLAPVIGDLITNYLVPFLNWLDSASMWVQQNSEWLTPLVIGVLSFVAAYKAVTMATTLWTAAQSMLNVILTLNPVGLIIAAIVALIALIGYVIYKVDGWGNAWKNTVQGAQLLWHGFTDTIKALFLKAMNFILDGIDKIKLAWYKTQSLWNEEQATANMVKMQTEAEQRRKAIAQVEQSAKSNLIGAASSFNAAANSLSWNSKRTLAGGVKEVKENLGLGGGGAQPDYKKAFTNAGLSSLSGEGVTNGGKSSIVVNINKEMIGELNFVTQNGKESGIELENIVRESVFRALYSLEGR